MKLLHISIYILFFSSSLLAQTVDYSQVITSREYAGPDSIEEKLVRLAWQNYPENKSLDAYGDIAEKEVALSRWQWTKGIRAVYNINENTMATDGLEDDPNTGRRFLAYPRYNVGLGISLGDIITTPLDVKMAKKKVEVAQQSINTQKIKIRAAVLEQYYNYILASELLEIRTEENEETYANYTLISERFKQGEATLDDYNRISNTYSITRATLLKQETQAKIEKARLEGYIGVPLETVL